MTIENIEPARLLEVLSELKAACEAFELDSLPKCGNQH